MFILFKYGKETNKNKNHSINIQHSEMTRRRCELKPPHSHGSNRSSVVTTLCSETSWS